MEGLYDYIVQDYKNEAIVKNWWGQGWVSGLNMEERRSDRRVWFSSRTKVQKKTNITIAFTVRWDTAIGGSEGLKAFLQIVVFFFICIIDVVKGKLSHCRQVHQVTMHMPMQITPPPHTHKYSHRTHRHAQSVTWRGRAWRCGGLSAKQGLQGEEHLSSLNT